MERKEKGVEREAEKKEFMVTKLKRGFLVGKRAGPSTPSPKWRLEFSSPSSPNVNENNSNNKNNYIQEFLTSPPNRTTVSARKLCANLWEIQPHPLPKMRKGLAKLRRHHNKNQTFDVDPPNSPPEPDQPASTSSLRRHIAASLVQHHRSVERNGRPLQPVSPASYGSSMEVAPYNPAVAPSPLDFKGRMGESSYSLKTSTELLKVLNRIWSLEEQHASNMSLVKTLKMELDHCRDQIIKLVREKQTDKQGMDDLMKRVSEDKLVRKNREKDRIKAAIQSVTDELEDERKLRRHSESLHRKLARELSEVKSSFSNALKELEREMKARILLENLCDEFAKGIRDYEQEVEALKHKSEADNIGRENPDRLIFHISEAWLDGGLQMKLVKGQNNLVEKNTIVDKLSLDIETFLQAKRSIGSRKSGNLSTNEKRKSYSLRHSLESFQLNGTSSAPQEAADEEDCSGSDPHCFELNKSASGRQSKRSSKQHGDIASESPLEELVNSKSIKEKVGSKEFIRRRNFSSLQVHVDERMARSNSQFSNKEEDDIRGEDQAVISSSDISGATEEGRPERKSKRVGTHGLNSNHVLDHLIRNQSLSSEGDKTNPECNFKEDSCILPVLTGHASPVQQWMSKLTYPDFAKTESSLRLPQNIKENTLQEKLLEARLEGKHSRSKNSKAFF